MTTKRPSASGSPTEGIKIRRKIKIRMKAIEMKVVNPILMLTIAFLSTSCISDVPDFDSATVYIHSPIPRVADIRSLKPTPQYELTASQIKELAEWLNDHIENWKFKIEDTAPGTMVRLRKNNERVVALNIHDQFIKVGDKFRSLTEEERTALDRIIKKDE